MHALTRMACFAGLLATFALPGSADGQLGQVQTINQKQRTIHVTGTGEVSAAPDLATVHTGVVSQEATAQEALARNTAAMNSVMGVLKDRGVAARDVQTTSFNVTPVYKRDDRGRQLPEISAYRVQNQVRVRVREIPKLGGVLDALVREGSNQISGISFGIDDTSGLLNQARSRAIRDAQSRAEVYAQAAGVRVGKVLRISEQVAAFPMPMQLGFAQAEGADVPIAPGEQELQVTVQIVYELLDSD